MLQITNKPRVIDLGLSQGAGDGKATSDRHRHTSSRRSRTPQGDRTSTANFRASLTDEPCGEKVRSRRRGGPLSLQVASALRIPVRGSACRRIALSPAAGIAGTPPRRSRSGRASSLTARQHASPQHERQRLIRSWRGGRHGYRHAAVVSTVISSHTAARTPVCGIAGLPSNRRADRNPSGD